MKKIVTLCRLLLIAVMFSMGTLFVSAQTWSYTDPMENPRMDHTATLLSNGKVLVAGGYDGKSYLNSSELFDSATNTWSAVAPMANSRGTYTATLLSNGKVLMAGGNDGNSYLNSCELYDPATNSWSPADSMAAVHEAHTATLLSNGKVLVAGGNNEVGLSYTCELYDPETNTWSQVPAMRDSRSHHTATLLSNGKVLMAGGNAGSTCELYDPETNNWSEVPSMIDSRSHHTATLLPNGKVLVVGGVNSCELYDPVTNSWSTAAEMSLISLRSNHTATLLLNGKVLVAGGAEAPFDYRNEECALYDPIMNSWSSTAQMYAPRKSHTATLLSSGKVLVAGGGGDFGYGLFVHISCELFDIFCTAPIFSVCPSNIETNIAPSTGGRIVAYTASATGVPNPTLIYSFSGATVNNGNGTGSGSLFNKGITNVTIKASNGCENVVECNFTVTVIDSGPIKGAWRTVDSLPDLRSNFTATLLSNGKVLVAGGWIVKNFPLKSCELFDPETNTWSPAAPLTFNRGNHTATLLPNGKVLVVGGFGGILNGPLRLCEIYDPATNTWSPASSSSSIREGHTATLLANGKVLVPNELYDPATDSWSSTPAMLVSRANYTITLLSTGKVLVAGGTRNSLYLDSCELYDPVTNSWSAAASLPVARGYHTATLLSNGKVLAAGGSDGTDTLVSCQLYDAATNSWGAAASRVANLTSHTATLLSNGKVLVAGGSSRGTVNYCELYDPVVDSWRATASMSEARSSHTATLLYNGKVLVVGGNDNADVLSSCELYDPFCTAATFSVCPSNIEANMDIGACVATVTYTASATGSPDPAVSYSFSGATIGSGIETGSGLPFNKGITNVAIKASNGCGNDADCSFTVTVIDNEQPTFSCPTALTGNLKDFKKVVPDLVTGLTGTDNCGTVTFTQNPLAGVALLSPSNNKTYNVIITADDGNGNTKQCAVVLTGKNVILSPLEEKWDGCNTSVRAYPNPSKHQFNLSIKDGNNGKTEVMVYNIFGRLVDHFEKANGEPIVLGEKLAVGQYFVIVKQGNKKQTVKLIKNE